MAQRDAVIGWLEDVGCRLMLYGPHKAGTPVVGSYAGMWLDPTNAAGCGLPAEQVYDPQTNRGGVRCTLPDYMAAVFGMLVLGSEDAKRFFPEMGTLYLRRIGELCAAGVTARL